MCYDKGAKPQALRLQEKEHLNDWEDYFVAESKPGLGILM